MKRIVTSALVITVAGCASEVARTGSAGGAVALAPEASPANVAVGWALGASATTMAYRDATMQLDARVSQLRAEVAAIDARVPNTPSSTVALALARTEVRVTPTSFAHVSADPWAALVRYTHGVELRRLRLLPAIGTATREFYYEGDRLIAVRIEPDGARKPDPHDEAAGEMFFFGDEGLFAWELENGTRVDPLSAEFRRRDDELQRESARFSQRR